MENIVILAPFRIIKHEGELRFCHGECQAELPLKDFPKKPARFCKNCTSKINNEKYHLRQKEKSMYF